MYIARYLESLVFQVGQFFQFDLHQAVLGDQLNHASTLPFDLANIK
jgi:hypothetical protein